MCRYLSHTTELSEGTVGRGPVRFTTSQRSPHFSSSEIPITRYLRANPATVTSVMTMPQCQLNNTETVQLSLYDPYLTSPGYQPSDGSVHPFLGPPFLAVRRTSRLIARNVCERCLRNVYGPT
ncbi:hypothetical protein J6590_102121 [Homalodisca vitripennis]|nr:hypothetical protein J6590_102121 [Homalodisca vitripennis]